MRSLNRRASNVNPSPGFRRGDGEGCVDGAKNFCSHGVPGRDGTMSDLIIRNATLPDERTRVSILARK